MKDSKLGLWNLVFSLHIQVFPYPQRDRKLRFLNVVLAGLLIFYQYIEEIKNWNFWILLSTVLPNISQSTKHLRNTDFWSSLAFIFCQIVKIAFQAGIRVVGGGGWVGLMFIMKQFCGSLSAGNTVYKLKWGWKSQSFPAIALLSPP